MKLDFKNTCPSIDYNLRLLSDTIEQHLTDLIDDIQPNISVDFKNELIDKYHKLIYQEEVECKIEEIRELNKEMRDKANEQLTELEEEKAELESEVERLEYEFL